MNYELETVLEFLSKSTPIYKCASFGVHFGANGASLILYIAGEQELNFNFTPIEGVDASFTLETCPPEEVF